MIEGTYSITLKDKNKIITGHISGQYSTPDDGKGLDWITVDEFSYDGGGISSNSIITTSTSVYNTRGNTPDMTEWIVAIASAKEDFVMEFNKVIEASGLFGFEFNTDLLTDKSKTVTIRLSGEEIIFNASLFFIFQVGNGCIVILDFEKIVSYDSWITYGNGMIIFTNKLKYLECKGIYGSGNLGIYDLSNIEYIGKESLEYSNIKIVDTNTLPNETVYNFEPTIVEGEYEDIQVLKQWNLIKFADNCIIKKSAFYGCEIYNSNIMFDLCNISNESEDEIFKNIYCDDNKGIHALLKINNKIKTNSINYINKVYVYCEDEQFLRSIIPHTHIMRPKYFYLLAQTSNNNIMYIRCDLKYTPNITNSRALYCDINCLEYGKGHYTVEMTDDIKTKYSGVCVGYNETNKYYQLK